MTAPRILHCDDDPDILDVVGDVLREHDYEVVSVADGMRAYLAARAQRFDLLILDLMLGEGMTGKDVLGHLLRDGRLTAPVLLLTASGPDAVRLAFPYPPPTLHKPVGTVELLERVAGLIR